MQSCTRPRTLNDNSCAEAPIPCLREASRTLRLRGWRVRGDAYAMIARTIAATAAGCFSSASRVSVRQL
jgi:hypothetical protein